MLKLKFEFTDDFDNRTAVEKEFKTWNGSQFDTLLAELANCLIACGFPKELVDEGINVEI